MDEGIVSLEASQTSSRSYIRVLVIAFGLCALSGIALVMAQLAKLSPINLALLWGGITTASGFLAARFLLLAVPSLNNGSGGGKNHAEKGPGDSSLGLHQAGMAEVANGVLHNVANVLTSVNVSATLINDRLRQSRVGNLGKALAILREHQLDLGNFLSHDPKGKMLPGYLETLADHLGAEHDELVQEMGSLCQYIEHIKEIVAMQQDYARMCGVTQTISVEDLVKDALLMNQGAFERHGIKMVQEFEEVPKVEVDKHKVLQILINLMRNAKYALDELGPPHKQLTVKIRSKTPERVEILIEDNGIGIAAENLAHIFDHGFTTKRDGHGFGLHSGRLAAKEMGGSLTASSGGIGQGAAFSLELPIAPDTKDRYDTRSVKNVVRH